MEKLHEVEMPGVMRTLMNAMGYTNAKAFVEDTAEEFLDDLPFSEPPLDWEDGDDV